LKDWICQMLDVFCHMLAVRVEGDNDVWIEIFSGIFNAGPEGGTLA
jgi:hypothetical protein